jgi:hypothetical protein
MITAIFSENPLYSTPRAVQETVEAYSGFLESTFQETLSKQQFNLMLAFFTSQDR